jgi:hypothetical protein
MPNSRPDLDESAASEQGHARLHSTNELLDSICAAFSDRPETLAVLGKKTQAVVLALIRKRWPQSWPRASRPRQSFVEARFSKTPSLCAFPQHHSASKLCMQPHMQSSVLPL